MVSNSSATFKTNRKTRENVKLYKIKYITKTMKEYQELKSEFNRRATMLQDFYKTEKHPMRFIAEENKENIPDNYKKLLDMGYIKWSNTTIRTLFGGKGYCSLSPTKRGKLLHFTASKLEKM
jgi:hypothetical protein